MTPIAEAFKKEHPERKDFWENELKSLGIEPKRENELNDKAELEALAEIIKQVYYQDYKTAYSDINNNNGFVRLTGVENRCREMAGKNYNESGSL
jgi:hypothetical protein